MLGVEDNGRISGVKPEAVSRIKKEFANSPDKMYVIGHSSDKMSNNVSDNQFMSDKMSDKQFAGNNDRQRKILAYLAEHSEISAAEAAKLIGRSPATARRVLAQLVSGGAIGTIGANRNRKYRAAKTD